MFESILFYLSGLASLLGHLLVWWTPLTKQSIIRIVSIVIILASGFTTLLLIEFIRNPILILNMSYSGILEQYSHLSIIISSIWHFGTIDLFAALCVRWFLFFYLKLSIPLLLRILLGAFLFLWCPIGILLFFIYLIVYYQ
jgi:hypothetical protein